MIEVFFDCSSPWTYLAFVNLRRMRDALGFTITWRPILVGGIFNTTNPSVYAQRAAPVPAKALYMAKDLQDWARHSGIRILFPPHVFPVNSVKVMRGCLWLAPQGKLEAFALAAFEAYWGGNRDISQDDEISALCAQVGVDRDALFEGVAQADVKEKLRANTDELARRGGFGSPTIFVNGDDMYFGNDRLELVRAAVMR